jgi:hypothetical protein
MGKTSGLTKLFRPLLFINIGFKKSAASLKSLTATLKKCFHYFLLFAKAF